MLICGCKRLMLVGCAFSCPAGTPAQRKKLVLASVTGVLGSIYVVAMCMLMARNGNASSLTMLYKL
jgi:hypothetical protein